MAVSAIGVVDSSASSAATTQNANIGQDDFMRILLTQLRFQDPLKPVDNEQFVAQLAQFSALEINRQQSDKVETLLTISGADQAIGLLGKYVQVGTAGATGQVTDISFATGEPILTVKGTAQTIPDAKLSDVSLVSTTPR
jgi:flagellar basal-body rod modification protein FlgD